MATRKSATKSADSTPATPKATKALHEQSPVSEMGAEDESATDASRSKNKAGESAPQSTESKPTTRRTRQKD